MVHMGTAVSLPIADRLVAYQFYRNGLGWTASGELANDGIPEPLQFALDGGVHVVLVPMGGFEWVIGDREVAPAGTSECILGLHVGDKREVERLVERARQAGAEIIEEPGPQSWGYSGLFADPDGHLWMVSSPEEPGDGE